MLAGGKCERCVDLDATCEVLDLASERAERLCDDCAALRFVPSDPLVHLLNRVRRSSTIEDLSELRHLRRRLDEALRLAISGLTRRLRSTGTSSGALARALGVTPGRVSQVVSGGEDRRAALRRIERVVR